MNILRPLLKPLLRPLLITLGLIIGLAFITAVQIHFIKLKGFDTTTRFLLAGLLTVNIAALLTLVFFVGKNLYKLFMEMRLKAPGYKFRTKLVAILVTLIMIPSLFLFLAASGLATDYFNRLFSPQLNEPVNKAIDLARSFYDYERERVLLAARHASKGSFVSSPGIFINKRLKAPEDASEIMKEAFNGKEGTEVISKGNVDIIRAIVPSGKGVIVAEIILPPSISQRAEKLRLAHEDHLKRGQLKTPLNLTFTLTLGFLTLIMVFSGLWFALKISRDITIPIQELAVATEKIASGDLNIQVQVTSRDEIGTFVKSFNQMVGQLKDSKKSLEEAYLESDTRRLYLENILQNITSGVLFLDNSGRIVTSNRAACAMLRLGAQEVVGMDYRKLVSIFHSEDLLGMIRDIEGQEVRELTREIKVNPGRGPMTFRVTISGIRESYSSTALGMLVVFDDLTDIIKAQKSEAWQEVARRITHEIKNPLTPIKLSTERLIRKWQNRDDDFGAVFEKSTKTIINEVNSLKRLVDIFTKYGRMPEIVKAPADLVELVDSIVNLYKGYWDVRIEINVADDIPMVVIDSEQLKRAIINIIDNAIEAMKHNGELIISIGKTDYNVFVGIADTGPGIPDEEKESMFLPHFSKRKGGTGLGLAIADKIVTDHGGRIMVGDNQPEGSVFTIEIPISEQGRGEKND
jgi:two-component system, NtrC family, nitrogen regulation sensor histidine kinase NtrY